MTDTPVATEALEPTSADRVAVIRRRIVLIQRIAAVVAVAVVLIALAVGVLGVGNFEHRSIPEVTGGPGAASP